MVFGNVGDWLHIETGEGGPEATSVLFGCQSRMSIDVDAVVASSSIDGSMFRWSVKLASQEGLPDGGAANICVCTSTSLHSGCCKYTLRVRGSSRVHWRWSAAVGVSCVEDDSRSRTEREI